MTTAVWFSHPPDYGKLRESVTQACWIDPTLRPVVAIDRGEKPPSLPVEVIETDFNRGTHLDGKGIGEGVSEALGRFDGLVVKIDSDMMIENPFWKQGETILQRPNASFMGLYAIEGHNLRRVSESFKDDPPRDWHEAIAICTRFRKVSTTAWRRIRMQDKKPDWVTFL